MLKGAAVGERESPRLGDVLELIHGVQVERGGLLRLATGEEDNTWKGWHDRARQRADSEPSDLFCAALLSVRGTSSDHVWLEEGTLDDQVLVEHGLHDSAEDELGDAGALVDRVAAIGEDLGLDDGHEAVVLADGTVAGKGVGSLADGDHRWAAISDLEHGSPLGEAAALGVELGSAAIETVETLGSGLAIGAADGNDSLIELDTGLDATRAEELDEVLSTGSGLVDGLLVQDDAGDVLLDSWGGEEELSVSTSVVFGVLN